jgi:hypothetical protein
MVVVVVAVKVDEVVRVVDVGVVVSVLVANFVMVVVVVVIGEPYPGHVAVQ